MMTDPYPLLLESALRYYLDDDDAVTVAAWVIEDPDGIADAATHRERQ